MPTCRQVANDIASDALAAASWRRKVAVRFHLLMCRHCRRYARQVRAIGAAARTVFGDRHEDTEALARLERTIEQETAELPGANVD